MHYHATSLDDSTHQSNGYPEYHAAAEEARILTTETAAVYTVTPCRHPACQVEPPADDQLADGLAP